MTRIVPQPRRPHFGQLTRQALLASPLSPTPVIPVSEF